MLAPSRPKPAVSSTPPTIQLPRYHAAPSPATTQVAGARYVYAPNAATRAPRTMSVSSNVRLRKNLGRRSVPTRSFSRSCVIDLTSFLVLPPAWLDRRTPVRGVGPDFRQFERAQPPGKVAGPARGRCRSGDGDRRRRRLQRTRPHDGHDGLDGAAGTQRAAQAP